MFHDEAIEEMRQRRWKMLKEQYNNSLQLFFNDADQWQKQHPDRIAHLKKESHLKKTS